MNSRSPSGAIGRNSQVDESLFGKSYLLILTVLILGSSHRKTGREGPTMITMKELNAIREKAASGK
jgi:hypothetical protein